MGNAHYTLPDGREAGYAVPATCDAPQCATPINRGLDYLCGDTINGRRTELEPGCGNYHCPTHQDDHACPNPPCLAYPSMREHAEEHCKLAATHNGHHIDYSDIPFTQADDDDDE